MDTENVSGPTYTKISPNAIEVGAIPSSDIFEAGYAKRFAKQHLVCHRRRRLTTSLIQTSITICIIELLKIVVKLLETLRVIRSTLKFELPFLTRMIQLCPACADASANADHRTLYACGLWP